MCKFGSVKLASVMKLNVGIFAYATRCDLESGLSNSIRVMARKMVNYAWED